MYSIYNIRYRYIMYLFHSLYHISRIICMCHVLFVHSPVDVRWVCFHRLSAITDGAAPSMAVRACFCLPVWWNSWVTWWLGV